MDEPRPPRILIVEDDANDSFMLLRQIEKAQIDDHVMVIRNGRDAVEFLKSSSHPPLAVFLDLQLPGLGGLELLEKIREDEKLHELPVIVMTGSVNPEHESRCNRLGVTAYLMKPIGLKTFIKTVSHLFPKAATS